jgi:DNA-binding beta-propeller fold protein YncE
MLANVKVGSFPQEVVVSQKYNMAYVTCPEDTVTNPNLRGSVAIIDLNTKSLVKKIYTGHQPHGIAVDEANNKIIVANRNQSDDGPAPHHTSECGGRNGNLVSIDANTLLLNKKKIELSVDPYFVSIKF